jgi:hypothetical protein
VKHAALAVMATFHVQLGPAFESLVFSSVKDDSLRNQLQTTFNEHQYDPTAATSDWPKCSIVASTSTEGDGNESSNGGVSGLEIPTFDLMAELPADCIARMVSVLRMHGILI